MDFWPFICIFVTLVLILFFRRIDKRTINFNKFKRYAEKLSADFNVFLNQKKEDFSESMQDLDGALKKAAQILAKIEIADNNLKSSYATAEDEKGELENIKNELEKLKEMKEDISAEIVEIDKNLPSLKQLSRRIQKMGIEIVENEKALKNTSSMLPVIEKRVQEQTDKVLNDVRSNVLKEAKGLFVPVIDEYRASLELLKSTLSEELKRFKGEVQDHTGLVYQKIDELNSSIEACGSKLTSFESETIISLKEKIAELDSALNETKRKIEKTEKESVRVFLKKAEDEYNNYINVLESSQAKYKGNIFQRIEERAKDLSTYVTRLEGRVQNLLDDVKKETDKYGEVLNLKIKTHESEADVLKSRIISDINEEANRNLILIKPIVSEMNEKLLAYNKEF